MEDLTSDTQVHTNPLRLFTFILLAFIAFHSVGQQLSSTHKKALKLYRKADKKYKERDFESALALLESAVKEDLTFEEAYLRMGSLYHAKGQLDSVYAKFASYLAISISPKAYVLEQMAYMTFRRGKYAQSSEYLEMFLLQTPTKRSDREIELLLKNQKFAMAQLNKADTLRIVEMPSQINRFDLQYLPTMSVDQKTLIYTKLDLATNDEDIVISYKRDGKWSKAQSISNRINTELNEGACTVSADGRTMIYTACDRRGSLGSCDLYITQKTGDSWSMPKNIGRVVNSKYWESQPSLSADGSTLYFVSNRPGGSGGRDIWVTKKINQRWTKPQNLGPEVNTFKDETTPFIHFNGETLFFSSNGYPGLGGYDLYYTEKEDTTWSKPINLGSPINSFRDEVALLVDSEGKKGFFAKESNRGGGEILDSKIMSFTLPKSIQPSKSSYIIGKVLDEETKNPIKATIEIADLNSSSILYESNSDSLTGIFYMVLPSNRELGGFVKRKGYLYKDFSFLTQSNKSDSLVIELSKIQKGKKLVLSNIYFETNSYQLDPKSHIEIENSLRLLNQNPNLEILIEGHTDDTGDKKYNQSLSKKRANAVYKALIEKGINQERLSFQGFGETNPIKPNTSEQNRKSNRRIEFRVLRVN